MVVEKEISMGVLTDKMIAGALAFKKNRIWERLESGNLMALTFSDGSLGYVNVFGFKDPWMPEDIGFALYRADELYGYDFMYNEPQEIDDVEMQVRRGVLSCLQLEFGTKEETYDQSIEAIRKYCKKRGIRISGNNAYFDITRYTPQLLPQLLRDSGDQIHVEETLDFLNWLSRQAEGKLLTASGGKISCFTRAGKTYRSSEIDRPLVQEYTFTQVPFTNEVLAHRLKKAKKRGILACNVIMLPSPVKDNEGDTPYFPWILLSIVKTDDHTVNPAFSRDWDEKLIESLVENLIRLDYVPREIHVINERTRNLLDDFCRKSGIRLVMGKSRDIIEGMSNEFFRQMDLDTMPDEDDEPEEIDDGRGSPEIHQIIYSLSMMPDDVLLQIPAVMRQNLESMAEAFPKPLRKRLSRLWGWKK